MLVRRDYMRPDRLLASRLGRMAGATAVMSVALLGTRMALIPVGGRHVPALILALLITIGLVTYGALAQWLGVFDATGVLRKVTARFRRMARA
jgi:hypothetical protein